MVIAIVAIGILAPTTRVPIALGVNVCPMTTPPHCFSKAIESDQGNGYTGVKLHRYVLDLGPQHGIIFQFTWLNFPDVGNKFVEVGTEYDNGAERYYGYFQNSTGFGFLFHDPATHGEHVFKIERRTDDLTTYNLAVDNMVHGVGDANWTYGDELVVGLESYDRNAVFPTFASYYLKYKRWSGDWTAWAGKDGGFFETPMCGMWHLPTSWWAGENTTCD